MSSQNSQRLRPKFYVGQSVTAFGQFSSIIIERRFSANKQKIIYKLAGVKNKKRLIAYEEHLKIRPMLADASFSTIMQRIKEL